MKKRKRIKTFGSILVSSSNKKRASLGKYISDKFKNGKLLESLKKFRRYKFVFLLIFVLSSNMSQSQDIYDLATEYSYIYMSSIEGTLKKGEKVEHSFNLAKGTEYLIVRYTYLKGKKVSKVETKLKSVIQHKYILNFHNKGTKKLKYIYMLFYIKRYDP